MIAETIRSKTVFVVSSKKAPLYESKEHFSSHDVILLIASINYTKIYLSCGRVIISTKTLKKFEAPLIKLGFWRVHKSAIINPIYVNEQTPTEVKMQNGFVVKISRRRGRLLKNNATP